MTEPHRVLVLPTWRKPLAFLFGTFGGLGALGLDVLLAIAAVSEFSGSASSPSRSGRMEVAALFIGMITLYLVCNVIVLVYFRKDVVRISVSPNGSVDFKRRGDTGAYALESIREGSFGWLPIVVLTGHRGNERIEVAVSSYWFSGKSALRDLKKAFILPSTGGAPGGVPENGKGRGMTEAYRKRPSQQDEVA